MSHEALVDDRPTELRLREALGRFPRVDLGVLPTPLVPLPRLSSRLGGPRIHVKRDDLAGGVHGGNKTRMLEFVLAKAVAQGADTVVGGSAVQSNYSRQLAAACARLGLDCHLVLRKVRGDRDERIEGSLLLDVLYGAHVSFVEADRDRQREHQLQVGAWLERSGRRVYYAPTASDTDKALHAVAYASAAVEALEQLRALGISPSAIYVSTLDTTHAGLLLGLRAAGSSIPLHAISPNERAIFPDRTIEEEVARVATEAARALGLAIGFTPGDVDTDTSHVGAGYGAVTDAGVDAIRLFAATEGLMLDPVYTAKAAAGMLARIRDGRHGPDEDVVFWHTGGVPALFAYSDELGIRLDGPGAIAPDALA